MARYELVIETRGEDSSASATITRVASSLDRFGDAAARASARAQSSLGSLSSQFSQIGSVFVGSLAVQAANQIAQIGTAAIQAGFGFNDLQQRAEIAFTTMLGSADKARAMLDDLKDFAAKTPFEFSELVTASQKMLAMGFAAEQVRPTLTAIGDAVAGLGGGAGLIDQVTRAMGQMQAKGRAMSQEMLQLTEAGIPAWQILADKIGVSIPEAMKLVEKGAVDADTAIGALVDGMNARFGGMMAKQSQTFSGVMSTLRDNATQAAATLTQPFFDLATKGIAKVNEAFASPALQAGLKSFAANLASGLESAIAFITTRVIPAVQTIANAFANSNLAGALVGAFTSIGNAVNSSLIPALSEAISWIQTNLLPAFTELASWLLNTVLPALYKFEGEVISGLIPALVAFGQIVGPILGATLMAVIAILRDQVGPALQKIGDVLNTVVFPALKVFLDWVGPKLTPILQTAAQLIGIVIVEGVKKFANQLTMAANQAGAFARAVGQAFQWVLERVADLVQKMGELLNLMPGGKGNDLIAFANSMRGAINELVIGVQEAVDAGTKYARVMKDDVVTAVTQAADATLSEADALRQEQLEARDAANASKSAGDEFVGMGDKALDGATKTSAAAEIMSKVADKVRGMVEQALNPTTVDQRLQMTGNAWDEFRLRLEAVNSGTPLDQYGAAFVAQVQKMQQITGLALPDIAAKFKDFSLFANMDWLKGALESGAIDLEPIKARINEQIQQIIGQANLMKAAFDEVWSGLAQQTKLDLANALGLSPQAANNATQVFQALSGTQAQTAATTVQGTATATSALNSALTNTQALTNNVATALGNVPAKMLAVQNAETPFRETTLKLNDALSINNAQLKSMFDYLEKARGSMAQTPAALTALTTAFTEASTPMQAFNDNTLRPIANTLGAILEYMRGIIAAAPDFGDALSNVDVDSAIKPGSPSPLEITLGHILGHMEDIASVAPRTFTGAVPPPFGFNATENGGYNGAVNGGSAGRQIVFTGNIYVQNPANFDAFMEEINRRVDTIVVNGD